MEDASCQSSCSACALEHLCEVTGGTGATACYDRDAHSVRNRPHELQIESFALQKGDSLIQTPPHVRRSNQILNNLYANVCANIAAGSKKVEAFVLGGTGG